MSKLAKEINKTHIGVYASIIFDGKIALIKKARGPYTGKLDLPGGKVEFGEEIPEALEREIAEEIGAKIKTSKLIDVIQCSFGYMDEQDNINFQHIGIIYSVELKDNQIESLIAHDSAGAAWYPIKSLKLNTLTPFAAWVLTNLT